MGTNQWDNAHMFDARKPALASAALLLALVLALAALAQIAMARRAPTRSEAAAISRALHGSEATGAVHCFHLRRTVVATGGHWARTNLVPCNKRRFDSALAVLQLRKGRWHVRDLGTSGTGCTVAPAKVRRDLGLICP